MPVDHSLKLNDVAPSLQSRYRTFLTTTRDSAPAPRFGTLTLTGRPLESLPWHRCAGSHVPHKSLNRVHATFVPDADWAVNRSPPQTYPRLTTPSGSDVVPTLSTGHQWFACARLLGPHLTGSSPAFCRNAHHLGHCAEAASGGLNPHPVMRVREAVSHLSCSTAQRSFLSSCILLRAFVAHGHRRNRP